MSEDPRLALRNSGHLLARILDEPTLVAAAQSLPAQALGKVISHVGLEDAGEIVALATTSQLESIFDDDLWRSPSPGKDGTFDAAPRCKSTWVRPVGKPYRPCWTNDPPWLARWRTERAPRSRSSPRAASSRPRRDSSPGSTARD